MLGFSFCSYPINCKTYCFDHFERKLQPKRTYSVGQLCPFLSLNLLCNTSLFESTAIVLRLTPTKSLSCSQPHEVPDSYKRRAPGGGGRKSLEARGRLQQQSSEAAAACDAGYSQESDEDVPLIQVKQIKVYPPGFAFLSRLYKLS